LQKERKPLAGHTKITILVDFIFRAMKLMAVDANFHPIDDSLKIRTELMLFFSFIFMLHPTDPWELTGSIKLGKHLYSCDMKQQSKEGGTAEGHPARQELHGA
jgi:hypothetical protein